MTNSPPLQHIINGSSIRLTLPSLGAIASILTLMSFITGAYFGYTSFKTDLADMQRLIAQTDTQLKNVQIDVLSLNKMSSEDRQHLTNRLTGVERDIDFIKQGISELKLLRGTGR